MTPGSQVLSDYSTPETDISQTHEWIQNRLKNPLCFNLSVELLPTTETEAAGDDAQKASSQNPVKVIGLCGGHSLPEIGYIFDPPCWGRGYATEALKAFLNIYWEMWPDGHPLLEGDERKFLKAITGKDGYGSMAVLKKCGFDYWREEEEENEKVEMVWAWRLWRPGYVEKH